MGAPTHYVVLVVTPADGSTVDLDALTVDLDEAVGLRTFEDGSAGFDLREGRAVLSGWCWRANVNDLRRWAARTSAAADVSRVEIDAEDHEDEPDAWADVFVDGWIDRKASTRTARVPLALDEYVRAGWLATKASPREMASALLALLRALDPGNKLMPVDDHPDDCAECRAGETRQHTYRREAGA